MGRFMITLLLCAVIFLSGIVFGIKQEDTSEQAPLSRINPDENIVYHLEDENQAKDIEKELIENNDEYNRNYYPPQTLTITQKTAVFLEMGIKGFYNIVVEGLYQFSKLFF